MAASTMTMAVTGDSLINRRITGLGDAGVDELARIVRDAEVSFTNLETTLPRPPLVPSVTHPGVPVFAEDWVLDELSEFGFNLFSLANNHASDYSSSGLTDTMRATRARRLTAAGAGASLSGARSPAYLEASGGRVALIAMTSTNAHFTAAAEPRGEMAGRPGLNPLRFHTEYLLDDVHFDQLVGVDEALGTGRLVAAMRNFGVLPRHAGFEQAGGDADSLVFMGRRFRRSTGPGHRSWVDAEDCRANEDRIREARRQADLVAVSIHAHESRHGEWNSVHPADFLVEAAHRFVDAGADIVIGHGPHRLRGVELYRGKPIFYSLGNFVFMLDTVADFPAEFYLDQGLPERATPADVHRAMRRDADDRPWGFDSSEVFWQSTVATCRFSGRELAELTLHPLTLGFDAPRHLRGVPALATGVRAGRVIDHLAELSAELGTSLRRVDRDGRTVGVVPLG